MRATVAGTTLQLKRARIRSAHSSSGRERPLSALAALRAGVDMDAMLGHNRRRRLGQVKDLPRDMRCCHCWRQHRSAVGAALRIMIDHNIWRHHLTQGLARMSFLTAPGLTRRLAQAHGPRWLLQPVARRRLTAVAAVEPEPAPQLGDSILQALNQLLERGILLQKPLELGYQKVFGLARRVGLAVARGIGPIRRLSHWQLDSRRYPPRQENSSSNLGSYCKTNPKFHPGGLSHPRRASALARRLRDG